MPGRWYDGFIRFAEDGKTLLGTCLHCMGEGQMMWWDETIPAEAGPKREAVKREAFRELALHIATEHDVAEPMIRTRW